MELDDVPDDREPEPEAAGASHPVVLPEAVEDVREQLLADAATRVADRQARPRAGSLEPKVDATSAGGELDRVRQEVAHDLLQAAGIAGDRPGRRIEHRLEPDALR